jgi:hypothetical protein
MDSHYRCAHTEFSGAFFRALQIAWQAVDLQCRANIRISWQLSVGLLPKLVRRQKIRWLVVAHHAHECRRLIAQGHRFAEARTTIFDSAQNMPKLGPTGMLMRMGTVMTRHVMEHIETA